MRFLNAQSRQTALPTREELKSFALCMRNSYSEYIAKVYRNCKFRVLSWAPIGHKAFPAECFVLLVRRSHIFSAEKWMSWDREYLDFCERSETKNLVTRDLVLSILLSVCYTPSARNLYSSIARIFSFLIGI
jgi:hypothetical protein